MQAPPTSIFFASLHPAASHAEATIKPRMRNQDADISNLQVCFQRPEEPTPRRYHSGLVMSCPMKQPSCHRNSRQKARDLREHPSARLPEIALQVQRLESECT
jgi:hypothetical protein